jgi:uncharacterized protein YndB with AHSA1/START domain
MKALVVLLLGLPALAAAAPAREVKKEVVVAAPPAEVYAAWTTNAGAQTFFAPKTNIELRMGGPYEIFFNPDGPRGERGAEDLRVLAFVPGEMLAFEWSAPPTIPALRKQGATTFVVVTLAPEGAGRTRVVLRHLGWGAGADHDTAYAYFTKAWDIVLGRLQRRFAEGKAIDFTKS